MPGRSPARSVSISATAQSMKAICFVSTAELPKVILASLVMNSPSDDPRSFAARLFDAGIRSDAEKPATKLSMTCTPSQIRLPVALPKPRTMSGGFLGDRRGSEPGTILGREVTEISQQWLANESPCLCNQPIRAPFAGEERGIRMDQCRHATPQLAVPARGQRSAGRSIVQRGKQTFYHRNTMQQQRVVAAWTRMLCEPIDCAVGVPSAVRPNAKCRRAPKLSAYRGRPEVISAQSDDANDP